VTARLLFSDCRRQSDIIGQPTPTPARPQTKVIVSERLHNTHAALQNEHAIVRMHAAPPVVGQPIIALSDVICQQAPHVKCLIEAHAGPDVFVHGVITDIDYYRVYPPRAIIQIDGDVGAFADLPVADLFWRQILPGVQPSNPAGKHLAHLRNHQSQP